MDKIRIADFCGAQIGFFASLLVWLNQKYNLELEIVAKDSFSYENLQNFNSALIGLKDSEELVAQIKFCPTQVRDFGAFDSLFLEDQRWYPRLIYYEALRQVLVTEARELDIRAPAFVVGDGPQVRIISAVLSELGINEIYLVGDEKILTREKQATLKTRIGLKLKIVKSEFLTGQSLNAGLVINTLDFNKYPAELTDLSYFNFIKGGGYVMDLNPLPLNNPYLEEALRAELRVVRPIEFWLRKTRLLLTKLKIGKQLSDESLKLSLEEFLMQTSKASSL